MADIKNFGISGVGSEVQFGKRGAKLVQATDAFSFRKFNGDLTNLAIDEPTLDTHAATKGYVDDLVGDLDATEIKSADGFTKVDTDSLAGKVTVNALAGAASALVATFQSGVDANTNFIFDNSAPNVMSFHAAGSGDDVSMRIAPKGDGLVLLGTAETHGMMQADPGMNLTLAGGDDLEGSGGNLILRAGNGDTTSGSISFEHGDGNIILNVKGVDDSTGQLELSNGSLAVKVAATGGENNIDIQIAPKGTGKVDVTTSIIANVVDPVNAQDAATKNYVDNLVDTSSVASKVGSLQTREITVSTATMDIGSVIKGHVRRVMLKVTTAYSGGTSMTIGTSATPDQLVASDLIDETSVGIYDQNTSVVYATDTQLRVFISGGPSTGAATLVVEYIQG